MKPTVSEAMITELQTWIVLCVVSIAKQISEETGEKRGALLCPVCRTSQLRWSIAPNGHVRALCDRKCGDNSSCINFVE